MDELTPFMILDEEDITECLEDTLCGELRLFMQMPLTDDMFLFPVDVWQEAQPPNYENINLP